MDVASEAQLLDGLQLEGIPSYAKQSQADDIEAVATVLGDALKSLTLSSQERAALQAQIAEIVNDALVLVGTPDIMLSAFRSTLSTVPELLAAVPRAVIAALLRAHDTATQAPAVGETPIRDAERENQAEIAGGLRRWAVAAAAEIAATVAYVTEEDALSDRQAIVERIDQQAATAGDAVFPQMQDLRATLSLAIPGNQRLARVIHVDRVGALPALLLSFQLYGTTDRETEIIERNNFQHPSFLAGRIAVLSEAQ